jgi:hypothetical protein
MNPPSQGDVSYDEPTSADDLFRFARLACPANKCIES